MSLLLYAGGKKRTIKQLFVNIRNKVHDWWMRFESKHVWTARLIVYSSCLAGVVLVCFILFRHFNLFHTDVTSARYMLSALVQSQAAIVAIVITLTLIAVQLTASAYSPRVIDIFKKNPDMWILLSCYGVSIFYGFIVLKLVKETEGGAVSQSAIWTLGSVTISFESCVSLAYWLGVFTFVALFPYMLDVIRLLKPESIIKRLAIEITKDKIINSKEDPIQPIVDIIHGSIMKYDIATTRIGLGAVTEQVIEIIDSDGGEKISECFRGHLTRASRLAISREDEESTAEVIKSLETFGKSAADKNLEYTTRKIIKSIELIGKIAAKKGEDFDWVTWQAVESLNLVEKVAIEKGEKFENTTAETALSIGRVGIAAAENEREWPTDWAVLSLEGIGENAMKCGLARATNRAVFSLGIVVMTATRKEMTLGSITSQAKTIEFIEDVGKTAIDKGTEFKSVVKQAAESIEWIGTTAVERGKEFKSVAERAAVSIAEVGISAAEKGGEFEDATIQAVESLKLLGKIAAKNELEEAVCQASESLGQIGRIAVEKGLETATKQVVKSLLAVRQIAEKVVASNLAELTLSNEETIKSAIHDYESKLEEKDPESFQKFMKIYEQELEKLQAEK